MTKLKVAALAVITLICFQSKAQVSFGVSPSLTLNTAYVGYKINDRFMPYVAFQYFNARVNITESGERNNSVSGAIESYEETNLIKVSLIVPTLGLKYYAIQKDDIAGYFNVNFSKPLLFGTAEFDGTTDPDFEDQIDALSFWGGEVGFGAEYFFSDAFSVGGEFGLHWLRVNNEMTSTNTVFDPSIGTVREVNQTQDIAVNVNPTYARISFNFYFQ